MKHHTKRLLAAPDVRDAVNRAIGNAIDRNREAFRAELWPFGIDERDIEVPGEIVLVSRKKRRA